MNPKNWRPADILALVFGLCCFTLIALGINSTVHFVLLAITASYFGIRGAERLRRDR